MCILSLNRGLWIWLIVVASLMVIARLLGIVISGGIRCLASIVAHVRRMILRIWLMIASGMCVSICWHCRAASIKALGWSMTTGHINRPCRPCIRGRPLRLRFVATKSMLAVSVR